MDLHVFTYIDTNINLSALHPGIQSADVCMYTCTVLHIGQATIIAVYNHMAFQTVMKQLIKIRSALPQKLQHRVFNFCARLLLSNMTFLILYMHHYVSED